MADPMWYFARAGQRQGPFPGDELRRSIAAGTVVGTDLVWREGMPEWVPAGSVPELGLTRPSPAAGGPISYYAPAAPEAYPPSPGIGQDAGMRLLLPVGRSGWAIAAGYLGLFSVLACPAPIALVVSILAIVDIRKHPDRHGMGRAIFGLVMGLLGTVVLLVVIAAGAFGPHHR